MIRTPFGFCSDGDVCPINKTAFHKRYTTRDCGKMWIRQNCQKSCRACAEGLGPPPRQDPLDIEHLEPHRVPVATARLAAQAIPRRIWQTGKTFVGALKIHGWYMREWWELNPEYRYDFISDEEAASFVAEHATGTEQRAYRALLIGAQRADLFRILCLKYKGGVYADVDTRLVAPLQSVIPPLASGLAGRFWGSEFLVFEPYHPILTAAAALISHNVLQQVGLHRQGKGCRGATACVLHVTGPMAYRRAVSYAANASGCGHRLPEKPCKTATDPVFRRTQVCATDIGHAVTTW
eukprot:CAMPEP_0119325888 /NCGR_PEP_ID=MMETSP1333-20130426/66939_1 /TAXON_ID=418940 /ORGANISM="Scyphosphaera apsteinii, Strain RCC1455" /LENGTH=293 /DNA_ID=CAMNT_0007334031 /DNA_START=172 /DNA_END=1050 /DNA_ORIENTATION=-